MVDDFLADRLGKPFVVFDELREWRNTPIAPEKVKTWCEGWLRDKSGWTVEDCARVLAIIDTGYDGPVTRPSGAKGKIRLSDYRVGQHQKVPGGNYPVRSIYDVAQILTWITSHQRSVEMQLDGADDVLRLVRNLMEGIS